MNWKLVGVLFVVASILLGTTSYAADETGSSKSVPSQIAALGAQVDELKSLVSTLQSTTSQQNENIQALLQQSENQQSQIEALIAENQSLQKQYTDLKLMQGEQSKTITGQISALDARLTLLEDMPQMVMVTGVELTQTGQTEWVDGLYWVTYNVVLKLSDGTSLSYPEQQTVGFRYDKISQQHSFEVVHNGLKYQFTVTATRQLPDPAVTVSDIEMRMIDFTERFEVDGFGQKKFTSVDFKIEMKLIMSDGTRRPFTTIVINRLNWDDFPYTYTFSYEGQPYTFTKLIDTRR